jgi:hypothetical protein
VLHQHQQEARARMREHELIQAEADAYVNNPGEAQ